METLADWEEILNDIKKEDSLRVLWKNYINDNPYASDLSLDNIVEVIGIISKMLSE